MKKPRIEWTGATSIKCKPNPAKLVVELSPNAEAALGKISPGFRLLGLTLGRFSFGDLIRAILRQTGPADVVVSTWTAGIRDLETMAYLLERGQLERVRFMVGDGFATCQPAVARRLVELFGLESVILAHTHAKFAMIRRDDWRIVIRTSMNLSRNPRIEQFEIDDDAEIFEFYEGVCKSIASVTPAGMASVWGNIAKALKLSLTGGLIDFDDLELDPAVDVDAMLAELADEPIDVDALIAEAIW